MDPEILKVTKINLNPLENEENVQEYEKREKKSKPEVDFPVRLNLVGKCMNAWKNNNILGEFEFTDVDETNRPMFRRLEKTRDGEEVILFYFEWEKCWQIGGRPDDPDAEESCWVYARDKAMHPLDIEETKWYESHVAGKKFRQTAKITVNKL